MLKMIDFEVFWAQPGTLGISLHNISYATQYGGAI